MKHLCGALVLFSLGLGCKIFEDGLMEGESKDAHISKAAAPSPEPSAGPDASAGPNWSIEVANEHRICTQTTECVGIYVHCSNCALENCEGVHKDQASIYENQLNCAGFEGPECDYDCHPDQGLTQVLCDDGLCRVVD